MMSKVIIGFILWQALCWSLAAYYIIRNKLYPDNIDKTKPYKMKINNECYIYDPTTGELRYENGMGVVIYNFDGKPWQTLGRDD